MQRWPAGVRFWPAVPVSSGSPAAGPAPGRVVRLAQVTSCSFAEHRAVAVRILCDLPLSRLFDGEGPALLPALPLEEFEALATKLPVRSASGPCSTVIEKSAWVRT